MLINQKKLDLYLSMNYNVLFKGRPGVGKTSIIHDTFTRHGLKYKYFSASTMDPWVDLIGIPKQTNVTNYNGQEVEAIELIPPADLVKNKYDAIFIDELNRAPPKVLNALLEVLQFKSINGTPVPFKLIWAAINPFGEDENYQVEMLDPAMEDRFQIQIDMPYKLDEKYLLNKHGAIAETFIDWWNNQPVDIQYKISPRRLSDTITLYQNGGDVTDSIYHGNTSLLQKNLDTSSDLMLLSEAMKTNNTSVLKSILAKNISASTKKVILSNNNFEKYFDFINQDWISSQITRDDKLFNRVVTIASTNNNAKDILTSIFEANPSSLFIKRNLTHFQSVIDSDIIIQMQKKAKEINDVNVTDDSLFDGRIVIDKNALAIFKQKLYFYNNSSFKSTLDNISPRISFSLSKINQLINIHNIQYLSTHSSFVNKVENYQTKLNNSLALNLGLLDLMAEIHYKDKPNGVYDRFKSLLAPHSANSIFKQLKKYPEFDNVDKLFETKKELIQNILLKIPDHANASKQQQIGNLHLIGVWLFNYPDIRKFNSFEHFIYSQNHLANPSLEDSVIKTKSKTPKIK